MVDLTLEWDKDIAKALKARGMERALVRAVTWGGRDALRSLRPEASRRVRAKKALKVKRVNSAMTPLNPKTGTPIAALVWTLKVSGAAVPLMDYPHRDTHKTGVWVTVNKGARQKLRHAFEARMRNGHVGIFQRVDGAPRGPIKALFSTRVSEPVGDMAPELLQSAQATFSRTWTRVLTADLAKALPPAR